MPRCSWLRYMLPLVAMHETIQLLCRLYLWTTFEGSTTESLPSFLTSSQMILKMKTHLSIFIKIWGYWTHLARKPTVWTAKPSISNPLALPARAATTSTSTRSAASGSYHHQLNQNDYHIANLCKISNLADFSATGPDYWHVRVSQPNLTNPVSLHI